MRMTLLAVANTLPLYAAKRETAMIQFAYVDDSKDFMSGRSS